MIKNILSGMAIAISLIACNTPSIKTAEQNIPAAEKELRDAIKQHPDSVLLKENLIQYFRDNSNYGEAIRETENLIKKDSTNARLWDIKATLNFEKGDSTLAIAAFEKAVAIEANPAYLLSLGSLYAQTKNQKALQVADGLLKATNINAGKQALFIKGIYYSATGEKQKAIAFFDQCIAIDYTDVMAYREKAICQYGLNQFNEAIVTLQKSVALQTTFDEGYYWMGRCYEKLHQQKEAKLNYETALQLDPGYAEAKDALAKLGVQ